MLLSILIFIILLGVLVLIHEFGHFYVARRFGVRVEEFAFGFPPRIASITKNGVRYALNLIPIGGYVKIYGEGGDDRNDPESFSSRPVWQRAAIIVAGVAMNFALAWVLFSLGHGIGLPTILDDDATGSGAVTIVGVAPGSPAESAGVRFGDAITKVEASDGEIAVARIDDVQAFVSDHHGKEITIEFQRGRETLSVRAVPRSSPPEGEGALGIAMARMGVVRSPWWRAPYDGAKTTLSATLAIVNALGTTVRDLFAEGTVSADVSGPVGVFVFANETRQLGLIYLLELAGVFSINLALLNILPIPALDGGRVLFLALEKVRGVRINERVEQAIHTVGFVALLLLMAAITYRDIVRFF
jgi:regulator of sigma E protease